MSSMETLRNMKSGVYANIPHLDDFPENPDAETMKKIDYNARHWSSSIAGPIIIGSDDHKHATCQMFRETFNPYRPSVIKWPKLDDEALQRVTSLPVWNIAVHTEGKAHLRMAAYAKTVQDPEMRDALAQNAWEEERHKVVLDEMVKFYGIKIAPGVYEVPKHPEWAYLVTGFSECVDSFFGFGLFELARKSGFFPKELTDTFEPVMQEEARHILLFANWLAWHRANLPLTDRVLFEIKVWAVWLFLFYERIGMMKVTDAEGNTVYEDTKFTMNGAKDMTSTPLNVTELLEICLRQNEDRFVGYDHRLLRPTTTPRAVKCVHTILKTVGPLFKKKSHSQPQLEAGSEAHKKLFCEQFIATHQKFDPETLPWPELSEEDLQKLRQVPFWQEVYHTERRAGVIIDKFLPQVKDPLVHEALAVQAVEESRHAKLIEVMIKKYGLNATPQPIEKLPDDLETAFIDFGYGECLDAFLGFGAFKSARQSKFLPEPLFEIFDLLMFEETRHIVFFINYMAWREKQKGLGSVRRALKSTRFYGRALKRLLGMVRRGQNPNDGRDFAVTQANLFLEGFSFRQFVEDCYRENARRMKEFDPDLMQPRLLPTMADLAVQGLRVWDKARPHLNPYSVKKAV